MFRTTLIGMVPVLVNDLYEGVKSLFTEEVHIKKGYDKYKFSDKEKQYIAIAWEMIKEGKTFKGCDTQKELTEHFNSYFGVDKSINTYRSIYNGLQK